MSKAVVYSFLSGLMLFSSLSFGCDDVLKGFKQDCEFQDRYIKVREIYRKHKLDITDVAEYKALRFIDRGSWDNNIYGDKKSPLLIYQPAPATWIVWSEGIAQFFAGDSGKGLLSQKLSEKKGFDKKFISRINKTLLTNGTYNTKDPNTDRFKYPGEYRSLFDDKVGFCSQLDLNLDRQIVFNSQSSVIKYQSEWEQKAGVTLAQVAEQQNVRPSRNATMLVPLKITGEKCAEDKGNFITFASSMDVSNHIEWLQAFLRYNIKRYNESNPVISPVELSAVVQKWFVTIHPFADGNGRTSRAIQDMILQNFDLPFAPAGDLQVDTEEPVADYIKETYDSMDDMLKFLEGCAGKVESGAELDYGCKSVSELNKQ